jgi:hypothetical protein
MEYQLTHSILEHHFFVVNLGCCRKGFFMNTLNESTIKKYTVGDIGLAVDLFF